jgi:hypothetical protein
MAVSSDIGDVEMLGILAAILVAGYIGYQIYEAAQAAKNAPGQAAQAVLDNVTGSSDPLVAGIENAWSAITDPFGNSMVGGNTVTDSAGNTAAY